VFSPASAVFPVILILFELINYSNLNIPIFITMLFKISVVNAIKDFLEDWARHQSDRKIN
jgi:hypothetical protein